MIQHSRSKTWQTFLTVIIAISSGFATRTDAQPIHVYLTWQGNTSTTMTVNYQTLGSTQQSSVYYDTLPRNGDVATYAYHVEGDFHKIERLDIHSERTVHVVELTDLIPGQTYFFVVGDPETGFSEEKKFRTISDSNGTLRFVTGGDMSTSSKVPALLMHAAEQDPMFGLIGGDIAYANGRLDNWRKWDTWLENWETFMVTPDGYSIPIVMAIGNHEVNDEDDVEPARMAPFYFGYFAQAEMSYFTMRFGTNAVLFVLDSGHVAPHAGLQSEWLAAEMAKFEIVPNKMAIYHVPMYPGHREFDESLSQAARTHWLPIFDNFALTVGFENHDHVMKRTKLLKANQPNDSGTLYIGDGCFGKGPRSPDQEGAYYLERLEKKRHFWLVEVPDSTDQSASGMVFTAIDNDGLMFDSYELPRKLSVSIIEPANHADFNRGDNVDLRGSAIFRGGTIALVEFFHAGTKIGEDLSPPYEVTWSNLPLGDLQLTALATGMDGSSAWSDTVNISVHPRGYEKTVLTFEPTEDTYVRPKRKSRNYGDRTYLQLHGTPDFYNTYLKFAVTDVTGHILSAKLRLFSLDNNQTGGSLYSIPNEFIDSGQPWGEAGLIAANAPPIAGNPLDGQGVVIQRQWYDYDVSEAITGDSTVSFALQIDHGELEYSSKEGSHPPQLVVEFVRPLPIISAFTPLYGTPGSVVTITGANFDSTKVVTFNDTATRHFEVTSDTSIQVMVPVQATSGKIAITNHEGTTVTVEDFTVLRAPFISDFTPKRGAEKSEIVIVGDNFTAVSQVAFAGVLAREFVIESNSRIRVVLPDSARTGKLLVTNPEGSTQTSDDFVLLMPPSITSFAPSNGAAGTWLTITGSNFDDSTKVAFHDSVLTSVESDSSTQLRTRVPEQARTGTIRVFNDALYAESAEPFVVLNPPRIADFSPSQGPIGTVVTFRGQNLETTTSVAFNGVAADSFAVVSGDEVHAVVPDSASTGIVSIVNLDGTAESQKAFTVVHPPTVLSFEPAKAKVGSQVTIVGTNFMTTKELAFNGISDTSFVVHSSTEIEGILPEDATTGPISVSNLAGTATSSQDFVVEPDVIPVASIFEAIEDSYVRSSLPQQSHGSTSELRVRATSAAETRTYLKFNVTGLTGEVQSAKLRLLMTNVSGDAGSVFVISNSSRESLEPWTEEDLTWNNAPETLGPALSSVDTIGAAGLIEFDISPALQANGIYSFVIKNSSADMAIYSSKEGLFAPELEVISLEPAAKLPPQIRSFWPQFGNPGDQISILGSYFENSDEVSLNGVPVNFSIVSGTHIQATVPGHAESGPLHVRSALGEGVAADIFAIGEPERSFALLPTDDAYVRSNKPSKNYGTFAALSVRETSSASYVTYFKFEISGLVSAPTAAMLKLCAMESSVDGGAVYVATNNFNQSNVPWNEDELNWDNAPEIHGASLSVIGPVDSSASVMIDLSSLVPGNGTITIAIRNTSSDAVKYSSKEGIVPPELWIHTGPGAVASKVTPQPLETFASELVAIPQKLGLRQNYPNPFNQDTVIEYALPHDSNVQLSIYNLLGQAVRTLIDRVQQAGIKRVRWNGLDGNGRELTSGIYFVRLQTARQQLTRKLILQK